MEKEFNINEYSVCINPEKESIYDDANFKVIIYTAKFENNWAYGYDLQIKKSCWRNSGLPGFNKYRKKYDSQTEARAAAIKYAISMFSNSDKKFSVEPVLKALNNALFKQLELF